MKKFKIIYTIVFSMFLGITISACNDQLDINPDTVLLPEEAITNESELQELLVSCYDALANQYDGNIQIYSDLLSDDLAKPFNDGLGFRNEVWDRNTNIFNSDVGNLWRELYLPIMRVNAIEDNFERLGIPEATRLRMRAEGKFIRALCHFELLRLWAQPYGYTPDNSHLGIVLRDKTDYQPKARSTVAECYNFIIDDLNYAVANLPASNTIFADKDAARALLAMVYFQMNRHSDALPLLNTVIDGGRFALSDSIDRYYPNPTSSFVVNPEVIFGFVTIGSNDNRADDLVGSYRNDLGTPSLGVRKELYDLINSDTTDIRSRLVGVVNAGQANEYYVCNKFNNEYFASPCLTLTQLLLTRAEAAAETNDLATASSDINKIIARAYPGNANKLTTPALGVASLLTVIRDERRKELFCEGDRTQSLKRIGAFGLSSQLPVNGLTIRNAPWNCPGMALQFPAVERSNLFIMNETGGCN